MPPAALRALFFAAENFFPGPTFALLTARSDDLVFQEVRMSESWAAWPVDLRSCCAADAWARLYFSAVPILLREANLTTFPPRSRKCSCIVLWNAQSGSFALRGPVYRDLRVFFGCCGLDWIGVGGLIQGGLEGFF